MSEAAPVMSKVLIHDVDPNALDAIKDFCQDNHLIGLKDKSGNVLDLLNRNIDLGGIILSEETGIDSVSGIDLGIQIHKLRHELPIFLRRNGSNSLDDLPESAQSAFAGAYSTNDMEQLKSLVNEFLFNTIYPTPLVHGIQKLTEDTLNSQLLNMEVRPYAPYLVKDRLIYGELFSLIPLESNWCRGYMMLQLEESGITNIVMGDRTPMSLSEPCFRDVNEWLGETTNLVWGSFKNRFCTGDSKSDGSMVSQVPIITNNTHNYISFGTNMPQLVFQYDLVDPQGKIETTSLYQKFIFNLNWDPSSFHEQDQTEEMVECGDLELF